MHSIKCMIGESTSIGKKDFLFTSLIKMSGDGPHRTHENVKSWLVRTSKIEYVLRQSFRSIFDVLSISQEPMLIMDVTTVSN